MNKQEPKIFKLLDDFLVADKMLRKYDSEGTQNPVFYQKLKDSFVQINELLDVELAKLTEGIE